MGQCFLMRVINFTSDSFRLDTFHFKFRFTELLFLSYKYTWTTKNPYQFFIPDTACQLPLSDSGCFLSSPFKRSVSSIRRRRCFCKMRSLSVVLLLLGALISCAFVEAHAQVNFSPAWGKRAAGAVSQTHDNLQPSTTLGDCKLPFDGVVRILRLIQVEAERLLRCESMAGEAVER